MQQLQLELFLDSIRSPETKQQYAFCIKKYFNFIGSEIPKERKEIEDKVIQYIIHLKKEGMSYHGISNYVVPVKSFYAINDIVLNVAKIGKFMPEIHKMKKDRAYTHEEISKMVEIADERMRVVILLLASTGIRIGAVPFIKLGNLQDMKLTVYETSNEQYFTFITPECKKAVDFYLDMRSRYGEKLDDNSYLIREQFDVRCPINAKPRQMDRSALQYKLYDLCKRCGIDKKNIAVAHGFRKFFTTQLVNSKVNPEIREMLLGHKIGLASAYYRPTEQEMLNEYYKAVPVLTISNEERLKFKLEERIQIDKTQIESLKADFDNLRNEVLKKRKRK